jgi:hypothetical protein
VKEGDGAMGQEGDGATHDAMSIRIHDLRFTTQANNSKAAIIFKNAEFSQDLILIY